MAARSILQNPGKTAVLPVLFPMAPLCSMNGSTVIYQYEDITYRGFSSVCITERLYFSD